MLTSSPSDPTPDSASAMRLSQFLRSDFVVARLASSDVEGVVRELAACAGEAGLGPAELIAERLLERERAHPTVIGGGLAIPHATVPGLDEPAIGVALARPAVQFGPEDSPPVRAFFVVLSPPGHEREHVRLLARICRLVRHEDFIDRLESADDEAGIIRTVETVDAEHA